MALDVEGVDYVIRARDQATAAFRSVEQGMQGLERSYSKLKVLMAAGVAAKMFQQIVEEASQAEQASNRLTAVLRATGNSAGLTKRQLDEMADSLAELTEFDDEGIRSAEASLLKFGNIQGQVFRDALKLSADYAAFLGSDMATAAQTVGKALQSPTDGVMMLERQLGKLSPVQEQAIKDFTKMNDIASAQGVVLDALRGKIGDTAEVMNTGLHGATTSATKTWNEFLEGWGRSDLVSGTVIGALKAVEGGIRGLDYMLSHSLAASIWKLGRAALSGPAPSEADRQVAAGEAAAVAAALARYANEEIARQKKLEEERKKAEAAAKKALEEHLAREKRLAEEGKKSWVAYAEAVFDAADAENIALAKIDQTVNDLAEDIEGKYNDAWRSYFKTLEDSLGTLERENEEFGQTRGAIAATTLARAEETLAIARANGVTGDYLEALEREVKLRRQIAAAAGRRDVLEEQKKASDVFIAEQKRLANETERLLGDAIMRAFERDGTSAATKLRDVTANLFKTLVLRPIIQPVAQAGANVVLDTLGMSGSAGGSTLNTAGSINSLYNSGSSLYSMGVTGMGAYAGGFATTATASSATTAALIESGTVGWAGAGMEAGAAATGSMGLSAAIPYIGWAIAALYLLGAFKGGGGPKPTEMGIMENQGYRWIGDNQLAGGVDQAKYAGLNKALNTPGYLYEPFMQQHMGMIGGPALATQDQMLPAMEAIVTAAHGLQLLDDRLQIFGTSVEELGLEFVTSTVGVDQLITRLNNYYGLYYTEAERAAIAQADLIEQLEQLGVESIPTTKDAFRALVEAQDRSTAAGKDTYIALLELAPAFAEVTDALNATAVAAVNAVSAADVVADLATIQRERADTALAAMNDARGAVWDAYDTETQKLEDFAAGFREFSSSLAGARNALTLSPGFGLSPEDRYAEATRQAQDLLRRGQLGDLSAMQGFRDFAGTFLETSSAYNASGVGFQADKAWILAGFDSLQGVADRQTSIAEEQLSGVRQTVEQLVGIRAGVLSLVDAMAAFTGARDTFQRDANRAGGNLSAGAAGALYDIESQARTQRLSGINNIYKSVFGREGDVQGLIYYDLSGRSLAQIEAEMRDMRAHGSHAAGLDFVPFDNYRANLHYGERVQTRGEAEAERRGASNDPRIVEHLAELVTQNSIALPALISAVNRLEKRMAAIEDNGALAAARR